MPASTRVLDPGDVKRPDPTRWKTTDVVCRACGAKRAGILLPDLRLPDGHCACGADY